VDEQTEWFYLNTINWADRARLNQDPITVFTIGLGRNAGFVTDPSTNLTHFDTEVLKDPFQNIMNDGGASDNAGPLKSNFLARLANDREYTIIDPTAPDGAGSREVQTPDFIPFNPTISPRAQDTTGCVRSFEEIGGTKPGQYFEAPTIAQLDGAFQLVAKMLRPRLSK
jgi:hypothetical protein